MNVPKWLRRRIYQKLLERTKAREIYLCYAVKKYFPYWPIYRFPELWDRRSHIGECLEPFTSNQDRIIFLEEALILVENESRYPVLGQ